MHDRTKGKKETAENEEDVFIPRHKMCCKDGLQRTTTGGVSGGVCFYRNVYLKVAIELHLGLFPPLRFCRGPCIGSGGQTRRIHIFLWLPLQRNWEILWWWYKTRRRRRNNKELSCLERRRTQIKLWSKSKVMSRISAVISS